jgi:hypothetical protein
MAEFYHAVTTAAGRLAKSRAGLSRPSDETEEGVEHVDVDEDAHALEVHVRIHGGARDAYNSPVRRLQVALDGVRHGG